MTSVYLCMMTKRTITTITTTITTTPHRLNYGFHSVNASNVWGRKGAPFQLTCECDDAEVGRMGKAAAP